MKTIRKWARRVALALLALLAIAAILWATSRALYPTADQRDALAVMQLPAKLACLGNFAGCFMSMNTAAAYSRYRIRMQDFGARLDLLATLAWLRENAGGKRALEALLASRPQSMRSPARSVRVGEEGASLRIRMFSDAGDEYWSVPLPAALQE